MDWTTDPAARSQSGIKACCARLYENDVARYLLGDSFHPGGLKLTLSLGEALNLSAGDHLIDVASGQGGSAIQLARAFGCEATGFDYSSKSVELANQAAIEAGLGERVRFRRGDGEALDQPDATASAILCECSFCLFPDKRTAAGEFFRLLRPGGRIALSDVTRAPELPQELEQMLAWAACIADAMPVERYIAYLEGAGFSIERVENHDAALMAIVDQVRARLFGAELLIAMGQLDLPDLDFKTAKDILRESISAVRRGALGYVAIVAHKPD